MGVQRLQFWSIWDNLRVSGDLFRLRNRSKLVEGRLFAITDSLLGAKFINLYFIWRVG